MIVFGGRIVNEDAIFKGYIEIDAGVITSVVAGDADEQTLARHAERIDAHGMYVLPGVIDSHVHFRDPGLTHKGDMTSESRAAMAGGVTAFCDMPNCVPVTDTPERVLEKMRNALDACPIAGKFFIAATAENIDILESADLSMVPGVKLFMGSSTGNMAVSSDELLNRVFALPKLIMVHCEDDVVIRRNAERIAVEYPEGKIPVSRHPDIRSREACISSTRKALDLARRHGTRLHIAHVSTKEELELISEAKEQGVRVTCEACLLHLMFEREDYVRLGAAIKCNPAVKEREDRLALIEGCRSGVIDTVSTDHAPHLWTEKQGDALHAASGAPSVQFSLIAMLDLAEEYNIPLTRVVRLMCHNQADIFNFADRGYLRPGMKGDLVIVDPAAPHTLLPADILSKCGWSPFLGHTFRHAVHTVIN